MEGEEDEAADEGEEGEETAEDEADEVEEAADEARPAEPPLVFVTNALSLDVDCIRGYTGSLDCSVRLQNGICPMTLGCKYPSRRLRIHRRVQFCQ